MKSTGIVRNVDRLGRVVIPKELCRTLNINANDPMEIYVDGDKIILKKYAPCCIFCGSDEDIHPYRGKRICKKCIQEMHEITGGDN